LGKDHLLQIETSGYTEAYKRFYFRDIQALILCRTDTWLYYAVVFAALASLFALIALLGGGPIVAWIFGCLAALFALCLLIDLVAGPTSKSYLRTAVQTEGLVSLNRVHRARKVFGVLHPLITAAQGELKTNQQVPEFPDQPVPPVILDVPRPPSDSVGTAPNAETPERA
jgi:hypothetical protein